MSLHNPRGRERENRTFDSSRTVIIAVRGVCDFNTNVRVIPCYSRREDRRPPCKPAGAHLRPFACPAPETHRRVRDSHSHLVHEPPPFPWHPLCNSTHPYTEK